ncbi:hypothetical protein [Flavobacterium sp.]
MYNKNTNQIFLKKKQTTIRRAFRLESEAPKKCWEAFDWNQKLQKSVGKLSTGIGSFKKVLGSFRLESEASKKCWEAFDWNRKLQKSVGKLSTGIRSFKKVLGSFRLESEASKKCWEAFDWNRKLLNTFDVFFLKKNDEMLCKEYFYTFENQKKLYKHVPIVPYGNKSGDKDASIKELCEIISGSQQHLF